MFKGKIIQTLRPYWSGANIFNPVNFDLTRIFSIIIHNTPTATLYKNSDNPEPEL